MAGGVDSERVAEPTPPNPDTAHRVTVLASRIRDALTALPIHFQSPTVMEGLDATDLFALNTVLGATIEVQVVEALNRMRDVWDPEGEWPLHALAGIPARDWAAFLRKHTDDSDPETVWSILNAEAAEVFVGANAARAEEILATLRRLTSLLGSG